MKQTSEIIEKLELIALRVPPGDNWKLTNREGDTQGVTYTSLTDTLEAWFQNTGKQVSFRLDPLDSKLYAINSEEIEIKPEPIKTFSLYGEYSQKNENN